MKLINRYVFAILAVTIAVAAFATWSAAQVRAVVPPPAPVVLSGSDIGFRVTGRSGDTQVGELVVKVNGEWKPVQFSMGVRPLSK